MTTIYRMTVCSLSLSLLLILGLSASVGAEEYWLRAAQTTVDLPGAAGVPMWGYALDTDQDFATVDGPVTVPGPALVVTDNNLTIHLHNDLPEPTSLVIPGQNSLKPAPVFFVDDEGRNRVRSFALEAPAGGEQTYTYPSIAPGTYLYQSGTHPGVQVSMGLYGALSADAAAGEAYAPIPPITYGYDQALTYLFSEVDVAQHRAVADGSYGTAAYPTTMNVGYQPDFFLLNGQSYTADIPPTPLTGSQVLLRLLNAGLRARVPVIPGIALELLAEDGNPYTTPKTQASVDLSPGKTMDLRFTPPGAGQEQYLTLFDRRLGVSDSSRASQGMLAFMTAGTPSVNLHILPPSSSANRVELSSLPGGISCGTLCDQVFLPGTEISLTSSSSGSDSLTGWQVYDGNPGAGGVQLSDLCVTLDQCRLTLDADRWVRPLFNSFSSLTILAPTSGSLLGAGDQSEIRWAAPPLAVSFNVAYRLGSGSPWVSIVNGTSKKEVKWQVPAALNLRGSAQVGVTSFDADGNMLETTTSVMGLQVRDSVTLQQPNGGESLTVGDVAVDPYTISWSKLVTGSAVARVGLWYQLSAAAPWQFIAVVDGNLLNYSWALPGVSTAANEVRVGVVLYDAKGEVLVMDTSDAVFSLLPAAVPASAGFAGGTEQVGAASATLSAPPALQLLGPGAGEVLTVASGYTVLWQSLLEADHFSLAYSLDMGESWLPLAQDLSGDQYAWQIDPALQGAAQVLLRLEAFDATGLSLGQTAQTEPFAIE